MSLSSSINTSPTELTKPDLIVSHTENTDTTEQTDQANEFSNITWLWRDYRRMQNRLTPTDNNKNKRMFKLKRTRCIELVTDRKTKQRRRCLNSSTGPHYCHIHIGAHYGRCCYCREWCNVASQACGRCPGNFVSLL